MKKLFPTLALICLTGCIQTQYKAADGTMFSTIRIGTNTGIGKLSATVEGEKRSIELEGYSSENAEALGIVAEKTAQGVANALKPTP